jgi:hypothetical protein
MRVTISTIATENSGFSNLASLFQETRTCTNAEVDIDFSGCGFFDGNMAAPLQMIIANIKQRRNRVCLKNFQPNVQEVLQRNGFLYEYGYPVVTDDVHITLQSKNFGLDTKADELIKYATQLINMINSPKMSKDLTDEFLRSIIEIFMNAIQHAVSRLGIFCCAQYFPEQQLLKFTTSDAGVGIPQNVNRFTGQCRSDIDAIVWAIQDGNTTRDMVNQHPGGLGLKLIKNFIELNQGRIIIISGNGFYTFQRNKEELTTMPVELPGTTVCLEINTADENSYCLLSELTPESIF